MFSGGEIGSKIFRIYDRKQEILLMNTEIIGQWLDHCRENRARNLLCHHLSWCVAELLRSHAAAALRHVAVGGLSQQVGINGVCQLVISCGKVPGTEGLRAGVVSLLSAPLKRHQQLLQGPEKGKPNKKNK